MASLQPVVFESTDLRTFVQYVLDNHGLRSTLVVCSTKEEFLTLLQASLITPTNQQVLDEDTEEPANPQANSTTKTDAWTIPTLRLLASSRTLNLVFCPDVTHLRAYLAAYPHRRTKNPETDAFSNKTRLLAVLNPIALHRRTSAFSAQGLNRTLSIAVEAAHYTKSRLVVAECSSTHGNDREDHAVSDDEAGLNDPAPASPWDEEVSILNVTTKSFGAGERGWVGRTVKLRTIAERWCEFRTLPLADG